MPADVSKMIEGLEKHKAATMAEAAKALESFCHVPIVGDAQERTPVLTGALQASATVEEPVMKGTMISCTFGFNTNYAIFVHENLAAHHDPPGQAKFLEASMQQNGPKFPAYMAERLRAAH